MARQVFVAFFVAVAGAAAADLAFRPALRPMPLPARWLPAQDEASPCDGVAAGQTACANNCTEVLLCMGGTLDPIVLEECEGGLLCNAQQGACVNDSSDCVAVTTTISCNDLGLFPDPYDCTSYHICSEAGEQSVRAKCESGWAYDPLTTLCSKPTTDAVCTSLPIVCPSLGASGAYPGNPNVYYICVADEHEALYPDLYRCPHGGSYNPGSYTCVDS